MKLRQYIFTVLMICLPVLVMGQSSRDQEAADAYANGDYKAAISLYEEMLKEGESADLYYNLGNVYYKEGQVARAILNYERALLIDPGQSDVRFNLELARQRVVDKIEPVGEFFLISWKNKLQYLMSVEEWAVTSIILFISFLLLAVLFIFSRLRWLKKTAFFVGIFFFVFTIIANLFAYSLNKKLTERNTAILLTPTVTVKSSPDQSGTDLFILHEGTKIEIRSRLGTWSEIELENGNVGWLPTDTYEII